MVFPSTLIDGEIGVISASFYPILCKLGKSSSIPSESLCSSFDSSSDESSCYYCSSWAILASFKSNYCFIYSNSIYAYLMAF